MLLHPQNLNNMILPKYKDDVDYLCETPLIWIEWKGTGHCGMFEKNSTKLQSRHEATHVIFAWISYHLGLTHVKGLSIQFVEEAGIFILVICKWILKMIFCWCLNCISLTHCASFDKIHDNRLDRPCPHQRLRLFQQFQLPSWAHQDISAYDEARAGL